MDYDHKGRVASQRLNLTCIIYVYRRGDIFISIRLTDD